MNTNSIPMSALESRVANFPNLVFSLNYLDLAEQLVAAQLDVTDRVNGVVIRSSSGVKDSGGFRGAVGSWSVVSGNLPDLTGKHVVLVVGYGVIGSVATDVMFSMYDGSGDAAQGYLATTISAVTPSPVYTGTSGVLGTNEAYIAYTPTATPDFAAGSKAVGMTYANFKDADAAGSQLLRAELTTAQALNYDIVDGTLTLVGTGEINGAFNPINEVNFNNAGNNTTGHKIKQVSILAFDNVPPDLEAAMRFIVVSPEYLPPHWAGRRR